MIALCCALSATSYAQRPRFGIKTGLNVSSTIGGNETNSEGKIVDKYESKTGFQVGMSAALPLSDVFGVQGEVLYTQRGSKYTYEDKGFYTLKSTFGAPLQTKGDLRVVVQNTNAYIELPILVYVKPIKSLKIEAGISPMLLLDSRGTGEFLLQNRTYTQNGSTNNPDMTISLVYNYIGDGAAQSALKTETNTESISIAGDTYYYTAAEGAYYNNAEKPDGENLYKFFDIGANLGASYTFSSGLSFNLRGSYGLLDATNNRYERKYSTNTGAPSYGIQQFDRDIRNFNVALTVGFSF